MKSVFTVIMSGILIVGALMAINASFFHDRLANLGSVMIARPASRLFVAMGGFSRWGTVLKNFKNLKDDNEALRQENIELTARNAKIEDVRKENEFLRKALALPDIKADISLIGSVYAYTLGPAGANVLLNRGSRDGVSAGDVVISEEGVLIGQVQDVLPTFSRIMIVSDPNFKVTVRVAYATTEALAIGTLNEGMTLELIVRGEPIQEGDTVVTTGSDIFPPALIVGQISHVEANESQVFQKVKVIPAMHLPALGRVLILKHE